MNNDLFKSAQVLGYPIDFELVMLHLKQDMRDDWYSDTLGYSDIFTDHKYAMNVILRCLGQWSGIYEGNKSIVRSIPKKGFAERYSLETDFFDRFVYQSICTFLIPYFDPLLSHRVLSYRHNRNSEDKKYLFRNKISKWLDYEGLTYTFYKDEKYIAATDVSNFFENVSTNQLINSLTSLTDKSGCSGYEKGQIRSAIRVLQVLLKNWSYSGEVGLPQNRDASSFLSNVLLSDVDFRMKDNGHDYYRYVDDIRIVCDTEHEARKALQDVIALLRNVGMNINATKTMILSHECSDAELQELFPSRNPLVSAVENMWRSKSRRVFIRSIEYIVEIIREALENGKTQSRSFRFAVNRLVQLIEANLFDVSSTHSIQLLEYSFSSLKSEAVSTDQLCRLIYVLEPDTSYLERIAGFLCDRNSCLHDWQNHQLWILLASNKFDRSELRATAELILTNSPTSGEAAGVFIWLHSISHLSPIERLIELYDSEWPYQNQRYFLMAVSSCTASVRSDLRDRIPEKLLGTIDRSKKSFRPDGVAIRVREKPSLTDLYEDIKDYS